ncbi:cytochrome P450 71AU50-like [Juglans microcarpa x Juglans regia]|uniref:cytochrome P450 71AU50-like n=1 Tax=Juglans microcarpa x Juglans regia TaxID=2249226 RepID=UPI001B7F62DB|nr:cytochrome P450 71AU50-like [Juglans microcarpa x Juglans regia]XP_041008196.1 cytochrome P450 71AU50-like [Juglans microcarpa x Juglans regia]
MPIMAWTWTILVLLVMFAYLLQEWTWKRMNKTKKLPPGPRGLPIFGNLHIFGELPHRDLHQLAQKYGPIMHLRLGFVPTIVVSSPQAAELFLKAHDLVFASRPPTEAAKHIAYEQKNLSFSPYGSYWRNIRKMCTLELLSNLKINSFKSMRKEELGLLVKFIEKAASDCIVVDLSAKIASLSTDMSCRMVFGKKYMDKDLDERGFKAVIQEGMHLGATPNLGDYIPYIGLLDLQGLTRRMKAISKIFDDFFEKIIDDHVQSKDENKIKDFIDVMLSFMGSEDSEYRVERSNIKAIILDMLAGSMDTTATAVEWTISEVIKHPRVMKKLQKELEDVVGLERMVEESDLDRLEYLDMVVKETMRLHPVAPLLLPHEATEDITIQGFYIPKKSRLIVNVWAIGRDPSVWTDAEKFFPERFVGSNIDLRGHDFQLLPFGSGRRGCPGLQLGLTAIRLMVAQLVHCFDWDLPNNMPPTELDMTEEFGITVPRAKHLLAIPRRRLHK